MFSAIQAATQVGVEARAVDVEAHVTRGDDRFLIVGLPDTAVREASERVRAAVISTGRSVAKSVVVNLAPADLRKEGSTYDLPIALAALSADGSTSKGDVVAMGELALDGTVRGSRHSLPAALVARQRGVPCLVSPEGAAQAGLVADADVRVVRSLADAVSVVEGSAAFGLDTRREAAPHDPTPDLATVRGQGMARRALELAAAGGHHLLLTGPPGSGKSLLASCLPGILPSLSPDEALDTALIWSAAGRARHDLGRPPFRAPHHSASAAALLGGGSGIPVPGELSLAHRGVLYLDELGEFPPSMIDGLRQPLENGEIVIARKGVSVRFPADVQLIASTNPCPCGFLGDRRRSCSCGESQLERYRRRLSGPVADRFDMRVFVRAVDPDQMMGPSGEASADVRERVALARTVQQGRGQLNRSLNRDALDALAWEPAGLELLRGGLERGVLTGRGFDRVRRVARTLADLGGSDVVDEATVAEALAFRGDG